MSLLKGLIDGYMFRSQRGGEKKIEKRAGVWCWVWEVRGGGVPGDESG